ncbi:histidine utilization repressor [Endozoicomonas sp. SM1973]|uniref:Histidine utilization repressor n=1 Tax=Spartinivicinus marinus TaxID=2994442 RepID=A0A853I985_9GAMM|nr:histidine utilization repressor [Spartinivicinus marinus]MCX4025665.1 histidine utilization repressor [Spartinivicinus marinus]NYZ68312.1 histidine utilization repressor [Spartinivicinus marinus]
MVTNDKPRYQQIKDFIYQNIRDRHYKPHERIPTEHELSDKFQVSRMTANKAIRDLVKEGLLVRYPGQGTFVTDLKVESPLLEIKNIADEIRSRGHVHSSKVVKLEAVFATEQTALKLGVQEGETIFYSLIVHQENDQPLQVEERYVNATTVPDYLKQDFTATTPNEYLSKHCPLSEAEHVVEAIMPDETIQQLLHIESAEPCLLVNRRTWSTGQLISVAKLIHPGSRYKLRSQAILAE